MGVGRSVGVEGRRKKVGLPLPKNDDDDDDDDSGDTQSE